MSDRPVAPAQTPETPDQRRPPLEEDLDLNQVEPVLREWLDAILAGDEDRAWNLMSPEAQAVLERQEFDRIMASALPEGLGAFADAPRFHYVVVKSTEEVTEVVGVVSGEVTREGSTEFAVAAIPMRVTASDTLVEDTILDHARYYERQAVFASESGGPLSFRAGDELTVDLADPAGATAAYISVDADRRPLPTEFDPTTGEVVATLDRDLDQGRHVALVVVRHESGRLYVEPILFDAAAP